MATRTTNYGLYKPDPTDPFEDFRAEHNANMEIIDQNLGGGGGGGSVVTWNQIITSGIKIAEISINGTSTDVFSPAGGGGGVHIYSTTEQEVGEWIDGRTVYERTFDLGSDLSCLSGAWTDTGIPKGLILHLVNAQLQGDNGTLYVANVNANTNGDIGIYNPTGSAIGIRYITVQYTKDVAPPVHYIEYIESTGTQYIATGITPTVNSSFEIVLSDVQSSSGERAIFGAGDYASNRYLMTKDGAGYPVPLVWYYPSKRTITTDITSKHKVELYRGSITVDDVVVSSDTSIGYTSFGAVTIFNVANGYYSSYKLYSFKIYDNGNLVFEGLPAKDPDSIPCLYDTVSGGYFYNAGTGSFVAGGDI